MKTKEGDIIATSDAQKRAVKKYQEKMKRIPLDVPIEDYETIKQTADYVDEPVNRYIKRAIAQRLGKDRLDILDAAEAAGKTEEEFIQETISKRKAELDSMEKTVDEHGRVVYTSGQTFVGGKTAKISKKELFRAF